MNRIEIENFVAMKRREEGRNFYKDHSMDECIEFILLNTREESSKTKVKVEIKVSQ